ncbi:MAG: TonB-dependent receptor [Bacteroidota bacterium]
MSLLLRSWRTLPSLFILFILLTSTSAAAASHGLLTGTVTEAATGQPLAGANVVLVGTDFRAASGADGVFEIDEVPAGTYTIRISSVGFVAVTQEVDVRDDVRTTVDVALVAGDEALGEVVVTGRAAGLLGIAGSASEGRVGQAQLAPRPLLRVGEALETVPGLIATQHSGSGKANQFFLRGLNLDHGTDFAASIDGVPLNLPTHAHGQGYLDLGQLIPEAIEEITFEKGPLHAESGDFATAGRADIRIASSRDVSIGRAIVGTDNTAEGLLVQSGNAGTGRFLIAARGRYTDGPWVNPENGTLASGFAKWATDTEAGELSVTAMGYYNDWDATDQVAQRAVEAGLIDRLGALDPTAGGTTSRAALAGRWARGGSEVTAYGAYYALNLFSNFTYFLDDPDQGDQFEQADRRAYAGASARQHWHADVAEGTTTTLGTTARHDEIFEVGLYRTSARERLSTVREDGVSQSSVALFAENETSWTPWMRTTAVLRADLYRFSVDAGIPANSGSDTDAIVSPRAGIALGPWSSTEVYLSGGFGFHSNDARGVTITVDPVSGEPAEAVDPLVRTRGAEFGVRTTAVRGLQSTVSLWAMGLDSELLFVGDAGGTEARGESRHLGVEWANYYDVSDLIDLTLDVALTNSRFVDAPDDANRIENSIGRIITGGIYAGTPQGPHGALQVRHFGPRPLTDDGSVEAGATTLVNGRVGYGFGAFTLAVDVLNLLDSEDADVSYFYASRLSPSLLDEPADGVEDVHAHPVQPRAARLSLGVAF